MQSKRRKCSGQVIAEYALVLAMFVFVALALFVLYEALAEYGWRAVRLLALEHY